LFSWSQDEEEGALMDQYMSAESIRLFLEAINTANSKGDEMLDLSIFALSKGQSIDFEVGGFDLDYVGVNIERGKHKNFEENPLAFAPLLIKPLEIIKEDIETPAGQTGDFQKYLFYRYDNNTTSPINSEFIKSDKIAVEIVINKDLTEEFEGYLFYPNIIENYAIELYNVEEQFEEDSYQLITAEPEMPELSFKISTPKETNLKAEFQLKIEYSRDIRADVDYFPARGKFQKVAFNESWVVSWGNKIRGGKATLYCKFGNQKDTIEFHIRGTNPTEQAVKDYINEQGYDIWFLTRLIRQESNYLHLNSGTNYGPNWDNSQGCPNWGPPHGWGLMQLDLLGGTAANPLRPTAQELWDWKANIRRGVQFIEGEKYNAVNRHFNRELGIIEEWDLVHQDDEVEGPADQAEGNITYTHANSDNFNHDFGDEPTGTDRSFMDATWIKHYNGSSRPGSNNGWYYNLERDTRESKPYWVIYNLNVHNHNYVEAVSNRAE
jgi:hypothetical protein